MSMASRQADVAVTLIGFLAAVPALAHHSYAAFDRGREITLNGTVRTWEMGNPHAYLWLFVPNRKGSTDIWGMEAPAPTELLQHGFDKYTLKVGDHVTATLNPLRDGRHGGNLVELKLADGRVLTLRPPNDLGGRGAPRYEAPANQ